MKKIVIFISFLYIFISCSETSNNQSETPKDSKVEKQMTLFEFNELLVSHFDEAELMMSEIWEMDNQDASEADIKEKAEAYSILINKSIEETQNIPPIGLGGEEYLKAYVEHMQSYQNIFNIFINYAYILSTPDEEWDQQMGTDWMNNAEPVFAVYEITIEKLEEKQANYAVQNNLDIVP